MSASFAYAPPLRRPEHDAQPRHIEIVPSRSQRKARPRLAYALVGVTGLLTIFLSQLLLSIALSDGAYTISSLVVEQRSLARTEQALTEQLELMGSSQNLAAGAQGLGMVNSTTPVYLRLSDGAVLGAVQAASANGTTAGSLVPNSLLTGAELPGRSFAGEAGAASTQPSSPAAAPETPGVLPSPVTR